jgi:two-component system invasion response regulator UvrY
MEIQRMNRMAKKIIIVGEPAAARQLVRQSVALPQDTVLECATADEALKSVGVFRPDCVMLGVSLPAPGAFQAIRRLRKTHPEMRVVAVSHSSDAVLREAAQAAGAAGFVTTENLSELFLLAAPERLTAKPVRRKK